MPSDDVNNSKIVENVKVPSENTSVVDDVYVPSKISRLVKEPLVNLSAPISNENHVSSADISDIDVLVKSSTHITDESYVYEDDRRVRKQRLNPL